MIACFASSNKYLFTIEEHIPNLKLFRGKLKKGSPAWRLPLYVKRLIEQVYSRERELGRAWGVLVKFAAGHLSLTAGSGAFLPLI